MRVVSAEAQPIVPRANSKIFSSINDNEVQSDPVPSPVTDPIAAETTTTMMMEADMQEAGSVAASSSLAKSTPVKVTPPPPADNDEGPAGTVSDDSDDEVADFRMLLPQLLAERKGGNVNHPGSLPKRGEKDFEPTGFKGQERKLDESRRAMEMVISQQRRTGSKALSKATWYPHLNRAVVEVSQGTTISSLGVTARSPVTVSSASEIPTGSLDVLGPNNQVGVYKAGVFYPRYQARLELFPEEALYLMERGTLDCRLPTKLADSNRIVDIPLSLQHAFSLMMGRDGCTRERYQTYTYLKRLGYYVQRADVADSLRAKAAEAARKKEEQEADCGIPTPGQDVQAQKERKPVKLVTLWDLLLYIPRRIGVALRDLGAWFSALLGRLVGRMTSRRPYRTTDVGLGLGLGLQPGRGLLGIGGKTWDKYDSIYSTLKIIPSGHDDKGKSPVTTSSPPSPFQPYYYAWRPATQFKKTNPPLPEYRIAVVSARETSLPKLAQFTQMFDAVPMSSDYVDEEEQKRAAEQKKRNDESYGRGYLAKKKMDEVRAARDAKKGKGGEVEANEQQSRSAHAQQDTTSSSRLVRLFAWLLAFLRIKKTCTKNTSTSNRAPAQRKPNPFPPLKAGRRNVILAVVDHGTSSLLRFGEAEFEKWKLAG